MPLTRPEFDRRPPFVAGLVPKALEGQPAWRLVERLGPFEADLARDLIEFGAFWVNGRPQPDPERALGQGQKFRVNWPRYGLERFYEPDPQRIVYQDEDVLVYDKESGLPSQAVPHDNYNNVVAGLGRLTGLELRLPHRLDLGTSGLLLLAKNKEAASLLSQDFSRGQVEKLYLALTPGEVPDWAEKTIVACVARAGRSYVVRAEGPGKPATTLLKVVAAMGGRILWAARPATGRTHQIRLHLAFAGYPILGDDFYGGEPYARLALRALAFRFRRPGSREFLSLGPKEEELKELWPS